MILGKVTKLSLLVGVIFCLVWSLASSAEVDEVDLRHSIQTLEILSGESPVIDLEQIPDQGNDNVYGMAEAISLLSNGNDCEIHIESCVGETVQAFFDDFEDAAVSQANWGNSKYSFEAGYLSEKAIRIDITEPETIARMITYSLPVEDLRGAKITVSGMIKGENISEKLQSYFGVKLMLKISSSSGVDSYPNATVGAGTFDWQQFGLLSTVPEDAESVTLYLGLQQVTGSAWFDEIEVRIDPCKPIVTFDPGCPKYKGHEEVPTLRGAMVNKRATAEEMRILGQEWNANVLRWQLFGTTEANLGDPNFDSLLLAETDALDLILPACNQYGVMVVVDLHSKAMGMFESVSNQDKFVAVWEGLAKKYKDNDIIWAYDLKNEPSDVFPRPSGVLDSRELAEKAGKAIRRIDPETTIIVEPPRAGQPPGYVGFYPIDVPKVVYSVHMYAPLAFTHQTIGSHPAEYDYPGQVGNTYWDKAQLELSLKPVIDFALKYHVQIFVGEFSAIRWAPNNSAYRYLRDVIDIFEEHQWDWTYHAFREWQGWSVEHSEDRNDTDPTPEPNDRQNLLRGMFNKNEKPSFFNAGFGN